MTNIQLTVTGAEAVASVEGILTGGMVGVPVTFLFDDSWQGLHKTAVFRGGGEPVYVTGVEARTVVPWEVLRASCMLQIGVYGVSEDGTLAIPTVWVEVATVLPGADPEGFPAMAPTLPVWKQALDTAKSVREDADKGLFNGYTPIRGVDYWTEEDKQEIRSYVDDAILGGTW